MDITDALAPTSDQLDAIELVTPRTFTIDTGSRLGERDGKKVAEIKLVDFPRVWRPSKGMLDVLAACWGTKAEQWVGHRVTLYNDPEVTFGREKTGGVRISHLSHIDKARTVTIRASGQGRKKPWPVQPLGGTPTTLAAETQPTTGPADVARANLRAWCSSHSLDLREAVDRWAADHEGQALKDADDALGIEAMQDAWAAEITQQQEES